MDRKHRIPLWPTWKLSGRLLLIAAFLTLLTVFAAENFFVVEVRLIVFTQKIRLVWALLVAAGLGFAIGLLTDRLRR